MSIQARYNVYEPVGGKWRFLFSAHTVNKEEGAIEQLEDIVKTGPDARVAVILDTEKNRHVPIFRMNINNQTRIKALSGGWKDGDGGVLDNTVEADIAQIAEHVNAQLEQHEQTVEEAKNDLADDSRIMVDNSEYAYEGQPDFVVLNWQTGAYAIDQYIIPRPTEKQLRALNIAHGCLIGADNTSRQDAALMRICAAVSKKPEHCDGIVQDDKKIKPWVCLWKDHLSAESTPLRFEGNTVEFVHCGFIE